jgi:microsomal epoxide hydrolase
VVAPSLPGYGLSFSPGQKRFSIEAITDCLADLMTDVLGYRHFAAQGGDWGAFVCSRIGALHADKIVGIHINFLAVRRDPTLLKKLIGRRTPLRRRIGRVPEGGNGTAADACLRAF